MMTEVKDHILTLTDRAIKEIASLREQEGISSEKILRVGVKGGGCSGLSYILDFDEKGEFDTLLDFDGVAVIVDQRHALYLMGIEIDYESGLNDRGFIFNNPNAASTCGCGTSFST